MVPLYILLGSFLVIYLLGKLGRFRLASVVDGFAWALAIMFAFTGVTHFTSMKHDYHAMLPGWAPQGMWVITVTGALELAGALGLAFRRFRMASAIGLMLLMVAVFPANLHAALNEIPFQGNPPTALWPRTAIQAVFISLLAWVAIRELDGVSSPSQPS